MIICGDSEKACILKSSGRNFLETDCAIIQTHMMLKATELGLGTCWVGRINPPDVQAAFEMGEDVIPFGLLVMGYPANDSVPNERHFDRLPLAETVIEV